MLGSSENLLRELRFTIQELGKQGGLISPSVYDTAQILRLCPPTEGVQQGLQWLLSQQYADGGWGVSAVPAARDIPTLAAVLTLHVYRQLDGMDGRAIDGAVQAGLEFLQQQAPQWMAIHIDLVPIAGEMILPYLLEEAERAGLTVDPTPYARIFELRRVKLKYLSGQELLQNSAPTYSWEALGFAHQSAILHPQTGVGHSPAATAAWLHTARQIGEDGALCTQAEAYLARAASTTQTGIPGVMPMVYPITGFELCYGLYALMLTGLLEHPALRDVVMPKMETLRARVEREQGLNHGESFTPDVDDTAVAVAVLQAVKQPTSVDYVRRFWREDHFYTYLYELNPSVLSNAHALHALILCGERCALTEDFLVRQQTESGAWFVDKWHTSWRLSTLEVVAALVKLDYDVEVSRAGDAFIADQNPDGSWGQSDSALMLETSYSVIALQLIETKPCLAAKVQPALNRGQRWLLEHADSLHLMERTWLGKEVYSAIRVDSLYKLCATLSPLLHTMPSVEVNPMNTPELVVSSGG